MRRHQVLKHIVGLCALLGFLHQTTCLDGTTNQGNSLMTSLCSRLLKCINIRVIENLRQAVGPTWHWRYEVVTISSKAARHSHQFGQQSVPMEKKSDRFFTRKLQTGAMEQYWV